ncbi:hypothetical protein NW762_008345 [Fusarium torreyae]|uniref:F-box domain-containing protein n=1 Tax=Fusarium torreyae TaxID=1237075 RepID=A0A9W8VFV0_9HYPO|nr:hypothetical protein NW762_008345 [Fusarium torreyae]
MASLLRLPTEVLHLMAQFVPRDDLMALRQSCRRSNEGSTHVFGREYFHSRYVRLERPSLQALVPIAEHPVFGPSLHHLKFCNEHVAGPDKRNEAWGYPYRDDIPDCSPGSVYGTLLQDQKELFRGEDLEYLMRAAKHLINCKSMTLIDYPPENAPGRSDEADQGPIRFSCRGLQDDEFMNRLISHMRRMCNMIPIENLSITFLTEDDYRCVEAINPGNFVSFLELSTLDNRTISTITSLELGMQSPWDSEYSNFDANAMIPD